MNIILNILSMDFFHTLTLPQALPSLLSSLPQVLLTIIVVVSVLGLAWQDYKEFQVSVLLYHLFSISLGIQLYAVTNAWWVLMPTFIGVFIEIGLICEKIVEFDIFKQFAYYDLLFFMQIIVLSVALTISLPINLGMFVYMLVLIMFGVITLLLNKPLKKRSKKAQKALFYGYKEKGIKTLGLLVKNIINLEKEIKEKKYSNLNEQQVKELGELIGTTSSPSPFFTRGLSLFIPLYVFFILFT